MSSPIDDSSTTATSFLEHMPPLVPIHEVNSLSTNAQLLHPFPANPWVPFDPNLAWSCLPAQLDPRLLTWPMANNPLASCGTALTNYFNTESSLSMINLGHTGTLGPRVEDNSAAPVAVSDSSRQILETRVDNHASPQEQTVCETEETNMTK
ncbi:hypothetical protein PoHVEF18_010259 [Penicillium ochrochloron]